MGRQSAGPGGAVMEAPEPFGGVYDPIDTLAFVAGTTSRITLGTSVLDSLFQSPVILARRLATLDRLSGGRLVVGIGQGWMEQEFIASGVSMKRRGAGFEEHTRAMQAVWGADPVSFEGSFEGRYERGPLLGSPEQVSGDLERAAALGVGHIYWNSSDGDPLGQLPLLAQLRR
jgi:alkanesulfonate monooxygenase SsuD/methylene tetrahydromethanopterin reductase-like flavin-dependent oxidoreductase (luciferase family)